MSYIDMAVGMGFFLFFLAVVLMLSIQHFIQAPATTQIQEYRDEAVQLFNQFFGTSGSPSNWEDVGEKPSKLGLISTVYRVPITVQETGGSARINEPVTLRLVFDGDCSNSAWNTTVRMYDAGINAVPYDLKNQFMCSGNMLNESYIRFNANVSLGEKNIYYIFYTNDSETPASTGNVTYNDSAWSPSSGDAWTEGTTSWSAYGDTNGAVSSNANVRLIGTYSTEVAGLFDATKLGIQYNSGGAFAGTAEGKYIDAWLNVNDTTGLSSVTFMMNDGASSLTYAIPSSSLGSGQWYHFSRNLTSSQWSGQADFNFISIKYVAAYMTNSTPGISSSMKIDGLHFGPKPLDVTVFPTESELVISKRKVDALNNMSYDDLRSILGQDYRFRIEVH